jgi:hypothetical protein
MNTLKIVSSQNRFEKRFFVRLSPSKSTFSSRFFKNEAITLKIKSDKKARRYTVLYSIKNMQETRLPINAKGALFFDAAHIASPKGQSPMPNLSGVKTREIKKIKESKAIVYASLGIFIFRLIFEIVLTIKSPAVFYLIYNINIDDFVKA